MKVLISGAGIAGPTLAYWLARYGFQPTIVEKAPHLRTGGYIIDFWGLGFIRLDRATRPDKSLPPQLLTPERSQAFDLLLRTASLIGDSTGRLRNENRYTSVTIPSTYQA